MVRATRNTIVNDREDDGSVYETRNQTDYAAITNCLACGSNDLKKYFDAGNQPLANSFHDKSVRPPVFPLGLNLCLSCGHSQNLGGVNPDIIFKDYPYVSGTTKTLHDYFQWFVEKVENDFGRRVPLRVLDIGANDGSLLRIFQKRGHGVLGVDPAANIGRPTSLPFEIRYWNAETAEAVRASYGLFNAIIAMNVLGHVADPSAFLLACKSVRANGGRIYIQVSQSRMIQNGEFDTCYHEHLSFFEISSFCALAKRVGLYPDLLHDREIHGGSRIVEFTTKMGVSPSYEIAKPKIDVTLYDNFERLAQQRVRETNSIIERYRGEGHIIVGFGAAAKANTFLNYGRIKLDYLVDENPLKQEKLSPGMNIPVRSTNVLSSEPSKILFVITAWNFRSEIFDKIKRMRPGFNDTFMVYFPKVEIWQ